jgi:hypothetical protein
VVTTYLSPRHAFGKRIAFFPLSNGRDATADEEETVERRGRIKCWSRTNAALVLGCPEDVLIEIVRAGLVPVIEVGAENRKRPAGIVGEQFDYLAGKFVPLREDA